MEHRLTQIELDSRDRRVQRVILIEGSAHLAILALKLAVGVTTGSIGVLRDTVHSAIDVGNNIARARSDMRSRSTLSAISRTIPTSLCVKRVGTARGQLVWSSRSHPASARLQTWSCDAERRVIRSSGPCGMSFSDRLIACARIFLAAHSASRS